jgi:peptidoglycan/LPS O-acetylase OafA/YrhL
MAEGMITSNTYRSDIDGLRGLAILAVLGFHAFPFGFPGGFVGVDVFFVISGYLITQSLRRDLEEHQFSIRGFYFRRVQRLFPALFIVLASCSLWGWFCFSPQEFELLGKHVAAATIFVSNFAQLSEMGMFERATDLKPLLHLWALGVQEQFYLLWPILFVTAWLLNQRRRHFLPLFFLGLFMLSFVVNMAMTVSNPILNFNSPFSRLWELLVGGALAQPFFKRLEDDRSDDLFYHSLSVCGFSMIIAGILTLNRNLAFPGVIALAPTMGAALIIYAGPKAWMNRFLLSLKPMVFIGLISYPLYLWHWPLLSFQRIVNLEPLPTEIVWQRLALTLVLAGLTYWFFEKPFRTPNRVAQKVWFLSTVMGLMGIFGILTYCFDGLPMRMPKSLRPFVTHRVDYGTDARRGECWLSEDETRIDFPPSCRLNRGIARTASAIVVWGDADAARIYAGLRKVADSTHSIAEFARDACAPVLHTQQPLACRMGNEFVLEQIRASEPRLVVLSASWNLYPVKKHILQFLQTLDDLKAAGAGDVVVVGPTPQWQDHLPNILYHYALSEGPPYTVPQRLTFGLKAGLTEFDNDFEQATLQQHGARYISLVKVFCDQEGCLTRLDDTADTMTAWDSQHLTTPAAAWVAPLILKTTLTP